MSRARPVRQVAAALLTGALVSAVAWVAVLDPAAAGAVGLLVAGAVLTWRRAGVAAEPWRWSPERGERPGERREALELTWALAGTDGRVSARAYRRVRAIAAARFARHGLDLDSPADAPALRALVGHRVLATLTREREPWPRVAELERAVAALERLGPGQPARAATLPRSNPR